MVYGVVRNVGCFLSYSPQDRSTEYQDRRLTILRRRVSTFAALALDIHTQQKTTKRGVYAMPEDDKDAQKLNDLKSMRVRSEGYEAPKGQVAVSTEHLPVWQQPEEDIAYHNRYGTEEQTHGPLDSDSHRDHNPLLQR